MLNLAPDAVGCREKNQVGDTVLARIHRLLLPDDRSIGWVPYVWLVYAFGYVVTVAFLGDDRDLWAAILLTAVFLVFYFRAFWVSGPAVRPYIGAIAIVGMLAMPVHSSGFTFFIFAGSFCSRLGSIRAGVQLLGVLTVLMLIEMALLRVHPIPMVIGTVFTILISAVNLYYARLEAANAELKLSREEIKHLAAVAERERIARDLHDLLGHTLSVITVKAELAKKLIGRDTERTGREIEEIHRISREALSEVREAVSGYRSTGLPGELANARLAFESMSVQLRYDDPPRDLPAPLETSLALVVREAVTNVIRHSGASRCQITFDWDGDELVLEVRDNGRGGKAVEGAGLSGMRRRIGELGGTLSIFREDGWRLEVRIPIGETTREVAGPRAILEHRVEEGPA